LTPRTLDRRHLGTTDFSPFSGARSQSWTHEEFLFAKRYGVGETAVEALLRQCGARRRRYAEPFWTCSTAR